MLTNGPVPIGLFVCHRCDWPPCCNPAHLFLGTPADNMADKHRKGRGRYLRGTDLPHTKLTDAERAAIRREFTGSRGERRQLAARYGVSEATIHRVLKEKS